MTVHKEPMLKDVHCMQNQCARNLWWELKWWMTKLKCPESNTKQRTPFSSLYDGREALFYRWERDWYNWVYFEMLHLEHTSWLALEVETEATNSSRNRSLLSWHPIWSYTMLFILESVIHAAISVLELPKSNRKPLSTQTHPWKHPTQMKTHLIAQIQTWELCCSYECGPIIHENVFFLILFSV